MLRPMDVLALVLDLTVLLAGALLLIAIHRDRAPLGLRALGVVLLGGGLILLADRVLGG
jgi:hypothetical protein